MTSAYDKLYVEDAQRALADMLDYAVNTLKYNLKFFYHMFLQSSLSKRFARGDVSVISGKSGVEIAREVIEENTKAACEEGACYTMERSPEYWTGWALAYYQWYCGNDFEMIEKEICIDDICALYHPFHEMDISQFVDRMNERRQAFRCMAYLKRLRIAAGMSQKELAMAADIPLKTIQQYEQRQKNINKARAECVIRLSRVLQCEPEDLLE